MQFLCKSGVQLVRGVASSQYGSTIVFLRQDFSLLPIPFFPPLDFSSSYLLFLRICLIDTLLIASTRRNATHQWGLSPCIVSLLHVWCMVKYAPVVVIKGWRVATRFVWSVVECQIVNCHSRKNIRVYYLSLY